MCCNLFSELEVNFDNTSITAQESDSEVEICLVLNGSIAQLVMITVETRPKGIHKQYAIKKIILAWLKCLFFPPHV